jgi:hypothetical protein
MTSTRERTSHLTRLEVGFEYSPAGTRQGLTISRGIKTGPDSFVFVPELPVLADVELLLGWAETYVGLACRVETLFERGEITVDNVLDRVVDVPRHVSDDRRALVSSLNFGSPFVLHLLLIVASPPALAVLITGAKRLFGIDLEFKAHREKVGTEYEIARAAHMEAKLIAEMLERDDVSLPWTHHGRSPVSPSAINWHGKHATLWGADEGVEAPDSPV